MSDIDELLAELTQPRPGPTPPGTPSPPASGPAGRRRHRSIWWPAAGLALVAALLGGLWALTAAGGGEPAADEARDQAPAAAGPVTAPVASTSVPAGPAATIGAPSRTTAGPASGAGTPGPTTSADNPQGAVRYVTVSGGRVVLRGQTPTRAVGDAVSARLMAATGVPVVDELTIVPGAPPDTAVPVYVPDRLLFGFNSIEIGPVDLAQLDLTARLLASFPELKVRVVARTDATGSDELNLRVAGLRATAVCNYLLSVGASPAQIVLDPVGEADEPHDEATDDDAATDRHVELVIEGTLRG